jgi:AbiU2
MDVYMESATEVKAVLLECVNLLLVYFSYVETIKRFDKKAATRFDLFRWRIQLRVLENDLILRLCRLDDDDRTKHSLREALRSIRTSLSNAEAQAIDKRLTAYRRLINPLKIKARNYYLAHLSKEAEVPKATDFNEFLENLQQQVVEVINIFDMIAGEGEPIKYVLHAGSQERELDLRHYSINRGAS